MEHDTTEPNSGDIFRDKRGCGWYHMDNPINDEYADVIGAYGIAAYTAIARRVNNQTKQCYPSTANLAKLSGQSVRQLTRSLALLTRYKLVDIERRRRKSSIYTLLPVQPLPTILKLLNSESATSPKKKAKKEKPELRNAPQADLTGTQETPVWPTKGTLSKETILEAIFGTAENHAESLSRRDSASSYIPPGDEIDNVPESAPCDSRHKGASNEVVRAIGIPPVPESFLPENETVLESTPTSDITGDCKSLLEPSLDIRGGARHKSSRAAAGGAERCNKQLAKPQRLYTPADAAWRLLDFMRSRIKGLDAHAVIPKPGSKRWQPWCDDMDKLLRVDKRDEDEIHNVIDWCYDSDFWQTVVLRPAKLREHYTKILLGWKKKRKPDEYTPKYEDFNRAMLDY